MALKLQKNVGELTSTCAIPPPIPVPADTQSKSMIPIGKPSPASALHPSELGVFSTLAVWSVAFAVMGLGFVFWNGLVDAGTHAVSEPMFFGRIGLERIHGQANFSPRADDENEDHASWGDGSALDPSIPGGVNLPANWPQLWFSGIYKSGDRTAGVVIDNSLVSIHGSVKGVSVLDVQEEWALLEYKGEKRRLKVWSK